MPVRPIKAVPAISRSRAIYRKALVQQANKITSDFVACAFAYHPVDILVHHKSVNVPAESRIPGLHDFDRITLS